MSLIGKFKTGLRKTRDATIGRMTDLLKGGRLSQQITDQLEEALLEADVGVKTTDELISGMRELEKSGRRSDNGQMVDYLKNELCSLLRPPDIRRSERFSKKPWVIVLAGVNGSGKTTTAGKLAHQFSIQGKRTVIAAADTFRAAAVEQIEIWAKRGGARLIKQESGGDPAAVTFDAYQSAIARKDDVLIIDTAGRLQDKRNLMQELSKIVRVLGRFDAGAPHEVLLVIDATTGQNGLAQAKGFAEASGTTGVVVTKLDGTARGGIVIPIMIESKLPVEFIGVGEGIDDLLPFDPRSYVDALLED